MQFPASRTGTAGWFVFPGHTIVGINNIFCICGRRSACSYKGSIPICEVRYPFWQCLCAAPRYAIGTRREEQSRLSPDSDIRLLHLPGLAAYAKIQVPHFAGLAAHADVSSLCHCATSFIHQIDFPAVQAGAACCQIRRACPNIAKPCSGIVCG